MSCRLASAWMPVASASRARGLVLRLEVQGVSRVDVFQAEAAAVRHPEWLGELPGLPEKFSHFTHNFPISEPPKSANTSSRAGGMKNREPLKRIENRRHLKVALSWVPGPEGKDLLGKNHEAASIGLPWWPSSMRIRKVFSARSARSSKRAAERPGTFAASVILYADQITGSMARAIEESNRRRNNTVGVTTKSITSPRSPFRKRWMTSSLLPMRADYVTVPVTAEEEGAYLTRKHSARGSRNLKKKMKEAAKKMDFEDAARLRDEIKACRSKQLEVMG